MNVILISCELGNANFIWLHDVIKPNYVSVVVSQADHLSWKLQKDPMSLKDNWDPSAISQPWGSA